MQDIELPVLTLRFVSGLTGLSANTLRRWEQQGILAAPRRDPGRKPPRPRTLYSWREVEQLQQARYLLKTRRLPMGEVKRLLEQRQAASLDRDWVAARPKPKARRQSRAGAGGHGSGRRASKTPVAHMR